jgi:hypothetical protein
MEATDFSEAKIREEFVNFNQTTHHNPGHNNLHRACRRILQNLAIRKTAIATKIFISALPFSLCLFTALSAISTVHRKVASIQNALRWYKGHRSNTCLWQWFLLTAAVFQSCEGNITLDTITTPLKTHLIFPIEYVFTLTSNLIRRRTCLGNIKTTCCTLMLI